MNSDNTSAKWDRYVQRAQKYLSPDPDILNREEIDYKVDIGKKLYEAKEAVLNDSDDWAAKVKRAISVNFIFRVQIARLRDWIDDYPNDALKALRAIWVADNSLTSTRIRTFSALFPQAEVSGAGSRANVISVFMMGLDYLYYPPFRTGILTEAYQLTGYRLPRKNADEATLYNHALGFLDRFIAEAATRGLKVNHRLEAQSLVWALNQRRDRRA